MIHIAADHGGYSLKTKLVEYLKNKGYTVQDVGPHRLEVDDDYPDYVIKVIKALIDDPTGLGIVICRNGVGVSMFANKFKKVRCALSWTPNHAASSKNDDNSNVLALPSDYLSEQEAIEIVQTWLNTPFSNEERHKRRLTKVSNLSSHSLW